MRLPFLAAASIAIVVAPADAEPRKWTDTTGIFHVEAEFAGMMAGKVRLKIVDGRTIDVPLDKLSEADRQYVASLRNRNSGQDRAAEAEKPTRQGRARERGRPAARSGRARIEGALSAATPYEFVDTPLQEVVEYLEDVHEIEIFLDRRAMDDVGMGSDVPLSAQGQDEPLEKALDTLLDPLELTWLVQDDVLVITTDEGAESNLETVVYRVIRPVQNADALVNNLTKMVAPQGWDAVGGPGHVEVWPAGALVVSQSYQVHRQIQRGYAQHLERVDSHGTGTAQPAAAGGLRLPKALAEISTLEFIETPLADVARFLSQQHNIQVVIDEKSLSDVGLATDVPITVGLRKVKLQNALALLLHPLDLVWEADGQTIRITTPEQAEMSQVLANYDVRDLLKAARGDMDSLIDVIYSCIAPHTWDQVGGPSSVASLGPGILSVRQNTRVHQKLARLLSDLREVH